MKAEKAECDIAALAEVLDGTWGRSAEVCPGVSVSAKFTREFEAVVLTASTTVSATPQTRAQACAACVAQLAQLLKDRVTKLKSDYKERAGATLRIVADTREPATDVKPLGITSAHSQYLVKISQSFSVG